MELRAAIRMDVTDSGEDVQWGMDVTDCDEDVQWNNENTIQPSRVSTHGPATFGHHTRGKENSPRAHLDAAAEGAPRHGSRTNSQATERTKAHADSENDAESTRTSMRRRKEHRGTAAGPPAEAETSPQHTSVPRTAQRENTLSSCDNNSCLRGSSTSPAAPS